MRKLIGAIVVLVAAMSITAATAFAFGGSSGGPSPVTYTGQGFNADGTLDPSGCLNPDDGNTGQGIAASGQYLLWVLSGLSQSDGPVTLTLPDGPHQMIWVSGQGNGGAWKYVSNFFPLTALDGQAQASWGTTNEANNLVVSHGCAGTAKASSISTSIHDGATDGAGAGAAPTEALGETVHDSATVSVIGGTASDIPSGSQVKFTFFDENGQVGQPDFENVKADGTVDPALVEGPLHAGDYYYTAEFISSNESLVTSSKLAENEPLHINKGDLTLGTEMHKVAAPESIVANGGHVPLGTQMHDTVAITGGVVPGIDNTPDITTAQFTLNGKSVATLATADALNGGTRSADSVALAAGDYAYVATVAGNSDYNDATSGAHDEQFTVDKALLHITTDIHNSSHNIIASAFTNAVVHDTATVTGQVAGFPIESISFTLNGNAVGTSTTADPVAAVTARSVDAGPLANGSYTYKAHLDGNSNYTVANQGDSTDEPLSITSPPAWCSPGFWKNASNAAWMQTGLGTSAAAIKNLMFNDYVVPDFYPTKYISTGFPTGPTLIQVLNASNANTYGAAAGKYNLNAFNAVGAFLTSKLTGYAFTGNTSVGCPVSNGGVLAPPPTG